MTISNNYVPVRTSGNGVTAPFSANWQMIAAGNERVYWEDKVTGVQTPKVVGTDYNMIFDESGFTVTFIAGHIPPSSVYVVIGRVVSEDQIVPYKTSTGFDGKVTENSFDKITAITQDLQEQIDRALLFPLGSNFTASFEDAPQDGYGLIWDGTSGALRNTTSSLATLEGNAAIVAANIAAIDAVAGDLTNIDAVAADITNINIAATNIAAINAAPAAASSAATSAIAAANAVVAVANKWAFSTSTSMADPGTGNVRVNNASMASATQLAISALSGDTGNPNIDAFIATWANSTHSPRGIIRIEKNATNFVIFGVNGSLTDNTSWLQIPLSYITGAGSFSAADILYLSFSASGNDGIGLTDGDKGDIVVSSTGTVFTIDTNVVTNAKAAQMMANTVKTNATASTANAADLAVNASSVLGRGSTGNITNIMPDGTMTMGASTFGIATSAALPGSPTTTTQSANDNSTKIATTAYVDSKSAGSFVFLGSATASNSAVLDFANLFSSSYDVYKFVLIDIRQATGGANLLARTGTGGGPTYQATGYTGAGNLSLPAPTNTPVTGDTTGMTVASGGSSAASQALNGVVYLYNPLGSVSVKYITTEVSQNVNAGGYSFYVGGGQNGSATALTALRFIMTIGNIASGKIEMWGMKNS